MTVEDKRYKFLERAQKQIIMKNDCHNKLAICNDRCFVENNQFFAHFKS